MTTRGGGGDSAIRDAAGWEPAPLRLQWDQVAPLTNDRRWRERRTLLAGRAFRSGGDFLCVCNSGELAGVITIAVAAPGSSSSVAEPSSPRARRAGAVPK